MSVAVWVMMAIAVWHFAILVPDRFYGGIIGAFLAALAGGLAAGAVASGFELPRDNPPGLRQALVSAPGAVAGLALSYVAGMRGEAGESGRRG